MAEHQATRDAYVGVDLPLPDGRVIRCRPLTLSEGVEWFETLVLARHGDPHAQLRILRDFPDAVVPEGEREALEQLRPAEIYDLADRFLADRRPAVSAALKGAAGRPRDETATEATEATEATSSTSGSTT